MKFPSKTVFGMPILICFLSLSLPGPFCLILSGSDFDIKQESKDDENNISKAYEANGDNRQNDDDEEDSNNDSYVEKKP